MQKNQHYDIAIIGAGITGLSTAFHLAKDKSLRLVIADGKTAASATETSGNMLSGGLIDNFTRIAQRHGMEKARQAWQYSHHAFDATVAFAREHKLPLKQGDRIRLIETEDERLECLKAVDQLTEAGFGASLNDTLPPGSKHLLAQQLDEPKAAWVDTQGLVHTLAKALTSIDRIGHVESTGKASQHYKITTRDSIVTAELLIFANHLGISRFLPAMKEVLVASQDQWLRIKVKGGPLPFPIGSLLTWRHGHYWAHVENSEQLCMGGARFFRPLAGFEAQEAQLSEKIIQHMPEAWAKYFPERPLGERLAAKAGLDIRPCDEIPVIGPMYGESGIFLGAGFMGQGITLGFKAGQSLAKLVLGNSDELPRFFWPERHRSLSDS